MKMEVQKSELAKVLREIAMAGFIVVGMANPIMELATNIRSPYQIANAVEQRYDYLGEGPYVVQYQAPDEDGDDNDQDLIIKNYAIAFTVLFKLTNGPISGGYPQLMQDLADFEYLADVSKESFGILGHVLIAMPETPSDLEKLHRVLQQNSLFFAFPDETGELNTTNMRDGMGVYSFLNKPQGTA